MRVAIHQPNFLPWIGYFLKMAQVDAFIYLDNVPFSKQSYFNRVKIRGREGSRWLTVPVLTSGRAGQLIDEVQIDNKREWREKHLQTLRTEYGPAPFFQPMFDELREEYERADGSLASFNLKLLQKLADWLDLHPRFFLASELGVEGASSALLLQLVQAVGGDTYVSGPSGKDYLDRDLFATAGVDLQFYSFVHPVYPQLHEPFCEGLSTIGLLMNLGQEQAGQILADTESRTCSAERPLVRQANDA